MNVHSSIVLKGDLAAQIEAALSIVETIPARDMGEEIFRAALLAIAKTNSLDIPNLRNANADARRRNRALTVYDQRL